MSLTQFAVDQNHVLKEKKLQVGNDQEKVQSEKIPTPKTEAGKKKQTNNKILTPRKHFVSRISSYFPNSWPLSYINLTEI